MATSFQSGPSERELRFTPVLQPYTVQDLLFIIDLYDLKEKQTPFDTTRPGLIRYIINHMSDREILDMNLVSTDGVDPKDVSFEELLSNREFQEFTDKINLEDFKEYLHEPPPDFEVVKPEEIIDETEYRGYPWTALACMLYLKHKYNYACIVLPSGILRNSDKRISKKGYDIGEWEKTSLVYDIKTQTFIADESLWKPIKKCYDDTTKRFILIMLAFDPDNILADPDKSLHINMLIYDKSNKKLERFEPYGITNKGYHPANFDEQLVAYLHKYVHNDMITECYAPLKVFPYGKYLYQSIQAKENRDFDYFCVVWSTWYADLRMKYPDLTREQISVGALKQIKNVTSTYTQFIQSYGDFLYKIGIKLAKRKHMPLETFFQREVFKKSPRRKSRSSRK